MGCANSKNSDEASNSTPNPTGQQKRKVKRDSVVVTKARMAKQKGRPKKRSQRSCQALTLEIYPPWAPLGD